MDPMELLRICVTVFVARIMDVTLSTIRTIFIVDGRRYWAGLIGFFEVFIWFSVVREALSVNSNSIFIALSYAAGFAAGNILGGFISSKFVIDKLTVNIITSARDDEIIRKIRENGFAVTKIECTGREDSQRYYLYMEIRSNRFSKLKVLVKKLDPGAFITVNKSKIVFNGFFR